MPRILPLVAALSMAAAPALAQDVSLEGLQSRIVGTWTSISCEIRPQANPAGTDMATTPSYLTRDFTYEADGGFAANITVYADPACSIPAISYDFAGEIVWHDANPAVEGAWSQHYVLNEQLELTVLVPPMAEQLTPEQLRRRRRKNIALAAGLLLLVILFYVITVIKLSGNIAA